MFHGIAPGTDEQQFNLGQFKAECDTAHSQQKQSQIEHHKHGRTSAGYLVQQGIPAAGQNEIYTQRPSQPQGKVFPMGTVNQKNSFRQNQLDGKTDTGDIQDRLHQSPPPMYSI